MVILYQLEMAITSEKTGMLGKQGEIWYPGWEATDNGRPVRIGRANCLFRYLPINAGKHRIEMRYRPRTFLAGRAISLITIALIALFFVGPVKPKGRGMSYPAPVISTLYRRVTNLPSGTRRGIPPAP